jgi:hypothetical protein
MGAVLGSAHSGILASATLLCNPSRETRRTRRAAAWKRCDNCLKARFAFAFAFAFGAEEEEKEKGEVENAARFPE